MNRKSREKVVATGEEARKCFETGKLAEAKKQLLDDEYVRMVKEATYSEINKMARGAMEKIKFIKAPDAQLLDERFYTELAYMALQEGFVKCIKRGNLSNLEQDVADSLTRELAVEVLEGMLTEFASEVRAATMNAVLDQIVDDAVQEALDKFF